MNCFNVQSISMDNDVVDECTILQNDQNMQKIIKILSQQKYIRKIVTVVF